MMNPSTAIRVIWLGCGKAPPMPISTPEVSIT